MKFSSDDECLFHSREKLLSTSSVQKLLNEPYCLKQNFSKLARAKFTMHNRTQLKIL